MPSITLSIVSVSSICRLTKVIDVIHCIEQWISIHCRLSWTIQTEIYQRSLFPLRASSVKQQSCTCRTWCETICSLCWFDDPDPCSGLKSLLSVWSLSYISKPSAGKIRFPGPWVRGHGWMDRISIPDQPGAGRSVSYQLCRAPQTSRLRTKILVVRIRQGYELLTQTPLSSVGRTCNARLRSWGSLSPNP